MPDTITNVYVFGNSELEFDSIPLKILPKLKTKFPEINFEVKDPNEEWDIKEEFIIIDTVEGIDEITVFNDLKSFSASPRVTMHDFDAYANLRLLEKTGKLKKIKIIGIPQNLPESEVINSVSNIIRLPAS